MWSKGSTVAQVARTLKENGAMDYTVIVAATASDPAPQVFYAPFAGAAIGEYFRILVVQRLSSMMIYQSRLLPTERFLFSFVVLQDVKPTQGMYSISIAVY